MSGHKLSISIITPTGSIYKEKDIDLVIAQSVSGELTLLKNHAPIFLRLKHGELIVRKDGLDSSFTLFEGFINFNTENKITVMADNAQRSEELNIEAIKKAKEDAEKALIDKEKMSATEIIKAETAMRRAIIELYIAKKKNYK